MVTNVTDDLVYTEERREHFVPPRPPRDSVTVSRTALNKAVGGNETKIHGRSDT